MVITFLIHSDFSESAKMLDNRRLPNQRREAIHILRNIQKLKAMGEFTHNFLPYARNYKLCKSLKLSAHNETMLHYSSTTEYIYCMGM
jgi:hypothetical protein